MKYLLAAVLLLALPANGQVTAITLGGISHHFKAEGDYCEWNPGLGIEHGKDLRMHAGVYTNSHCRFSAYGGLSYTKPLFWNLRAGVALLGFTGYHEEKKVNGKIEREDKVLVAPIPFIAWEGKEYGLNIGYIPPDGREFHGLIFAQVKLLRW